MEVNRQIFFVSSALKPNLHLQVLSSQRAFCGHLLQYWGDQEQLHSELSMASALPSSTDHATGHKRWTKIRENQTQSLEAIRQLFFWAERGCRDKLGLERRQNKEARMPVANHWRHLVFHACVCLLIHACVIKMTPAPVWLARLIVMRFNFFPTGFRDGARVNAH